MATAVTRRNEHTYPIYTPLHKARASSGANPTHYPMPIRDRYPGDKATEVRSWAIHFHQMSRLRMNGSLPPLNTTSSTRAV